MLIDTLQSMQRRIRVHRGRMFEDAFSALMDSDSPSLESAGPFQVIIIDQHVSNNECYNDFYLPHSFLFRLAI